MGGSAVGAAQYERVPVPTLKRWTARSHKRLACELRANKRAACGYEPGRLPMITMLGSKRRLCDGLTRRETLKVGALSALGGALSLPGMLWAEENRKAHVRSGRAKSVI